MLQEVKDLGLYHWKHEARLALHDYHNVFRKTLRELSCYGLSGLEGRRVLDLGCGQRFPFSLLNARAGAVVTALDLDYVKPDPVLIYFCRILQKNGLKRAFKSTVRRVFFDRIYYDTLELGAGISLRPCCPQISFVVANPENARYPLPSESFDLIFSNAVVEHVADVSGFCKEVHRLLCKGGVFYAIIHNFYSLSGGHNLEWAYPDEHPSTRVPPWDHLRGNLYPSWTYLNRLKPAEYEDIFNSVLDVLLFEGRDVNHDPGRWEGERYLTPEVATELAVYPRDLLLTRSWCLICRKA